MWEQNKSFLLIYVNDLLITGNDNELVNELKGILHKNSKMKNLGNLKYFLGIEMSRSNAGIVLNQRKYALGLIEDTGLKRARPAVTPLEQNKKLTTAEFDETLQTKGDDEVLTDAATYQTFESIHA